ncbi:MAG: cupin domain-containing protein [Actinophytocola sp.]|uniref:cupin domain-containing protein n=1 Tax=Actinophytocola sp. TaxID=1872138 RepID=UPI00132BEC09|nr:cupin domain-containing protein [Actinophytocola sp.]MPZ83957.1 cupin domain-containing protein [Actinophytocola sp.]
MNGYVLTRSTDAELLGEAPNTTRLLVDADETGKVMNAVRTTLGEGVDGPPPHFHKASPEMFFLISGALRVLAGDEIVRLSSGDFLLIPPLMPHAWGTPSGSTADILIVKAPGNNRFDYFRLGDRIRRGEASPREVLDTQDRFDNYFLPSPIWRPGTQRLVTLPEGRQH